MIARLATDHPVKDLCRLLKVSRSGYYAWRSRRPGPREEANRELLEAIRTVYRGSRATYGSPRVTRDLHAQGRRCGRHRVARLMRQDGLRGVGKRRFHPPTTDSRHGHPFQPNRLEDAGLWARPKRVWVSDITFVPTREGFGYLAVFMDLCTRRIQGWVLGRSLEASLVCEAFEQAVRRSRPPAGLIVHSDRGSQYASTLFRELLERHGALGSMGRTGTCYDNATMESFFGTLKTEWLDDRAHLTQDETRLSLFDYIEVFYNRRRLHSSLGYRSPVDYEAQWILE